MGGFLVPNTTIGGSVNAPGIPFHDSPTGGIYETPSGGFGISLSADGFFDLDQTLFTLGFKPSSIFTLAAVVGSPIANAGTPYSVRISPDGAHAFVANNTGNSLNVYSRNTITGALTFLAQYATAASPFDVQITSDGQFVFVGGFGITAFSRNSLTGVLTLIGTYAIGAGYGTRSIAISQDNKFLYTGSQTSNLYGFTINANGSLTAFGAVVITPNAGTATTFGIGITPNNNFLYIVDQSNALLYGYSRDLITGVLTLIPAGEFSIGVAGVNTAILFDITDDGNFLYCGDSSIHGLLSAFIIKSNGILTAVAGFPMVTNDPCYSIAHSIDDDYLIVAGNVSIHVYLRNTLSGALAEIVNSPFAAAANVAGICVSPDNNNVYVAVSTNNEIFEFQTALILNHHLLSAFFSKTGGTDGILNVNGLLYVMGAAVLNEAIADGRYAALAGLITQAFSAKTLTLDHGAGGLVGTPTNDNSAAGMVGEYIANVVATPGVALASGVVSNVGSIALTPGDWDVDGVVDFLPGATTSITQLLFGISSATGALGGQDTYGQLSSAAQVPAANIVQRTPTVRISIAANTTIYLVAEGVFTVSTLSAFGTIRARRVR